TLTYNLELDKHNITALLGQAYNYDRFDGSSITSQGGYRNSNIKTLNAAVGTIGSTNATKNLMLSYFGRVQYAFDGKYLFSVSMRRDGSSRFGMNTKWGWFPSVSAGWRLSDENFMQSAAFIQDLKLRASYGESGNNNIGDYSSIAVLGEANYSLDGSSAPGWAPGNNINPDLTWEQSRTFDAGLDFALFQSRLSGSFDVYQGISGSLLVNVLEVLSTGVGSLLDCAGEVRSRGWDLETASRNIQRDNLTWSTAFNLSEPTSEVPQF